LRLLLFAVGFMRGNEFNALFFEASIQGITVVGSITNEPFRQLFYKSVVQRFLY
jgi:hypothetical protein